MEEEIEEAERLLFRRLRELGTDIELVVDIVRERELMYRMADRCDPRALTNLAKLHEHADEAHDFLRGEMLAGRISTDDYYEAMKSLVTYTEIAREDLVRKLGKCGCRWRE